MKLSGILSTLAVVVTLMASTSCSDKKFDVSGNVDNLVCYTETIELRSLRGIDGEIERTVLVQSYGVYNYGSIEAHILEIE